MHHDKGAAQRSGVDDIFMNILTTNGLVGRYVTDWAGPEAQLRNIKIRLGAPAVPGKPSLLIYGHYDVQPPDPLEEWETSPFEPTIREGRLYARGTADDKGQVYCLLKAYEASRDGDGNPPLNIRFLIEGEEESGGHVVADLLRAEPARNWSLKISSDSGPS